MQRIEFAYVFDGTDHILRGEDFSTPAGLRDRRLWNGPATGLCSKRISIGADVGPDRSSLAAAEPESEARHAIRNAGLDIDGDLDAAAVRRNGDHVTGGQTEPARFLRIEGEGVSPHLLCEGLRAFLEPRVVGICAVPKARIGAQN